MTPEQWYKIIYQKAVSLLEEEKNIYWGEKKQSERIKEQIQQIQDDYRNEKAKILNTKRELERFLDDAKNHYLNYIVLKPRNVENINMPSLKTLRLQIDDYSEYDPHARELYEYSLGGLELVNRVLSRLDKKQREEERRVGLNQVSDYKNRKETNKRRYFELLQSKEVEQLIECLKRVRRDSYLSNNFQYNPPQKEPSVFYIGQVAMPMPFPNYMSEEVRKRFGSFYDFSSCSLIFPKGFSTNTGGKVYIEYEDEMENSLIEGIKGVISNVLCCFPAYPERITYIDPITCNSLCLEEMRKIVSKVKCPGLIRFPEEKKAVKSVLVSLEEELKKEKGNSRTRFLIIKGYPDYYDSESREILQRLCASVNIYHLIVLIMKTKQEDERRNVFENQLIKQSVRVSTQNGKFIQISKDGTRQRPFFWYSSIKKISDEELKKIQKDYVPKEKGTRYLERVNPEFPPNYQRGNREIQWPFGIDSSGNVHKETIEKMYFAAFLMGGSGSGKSTLLENLINNLVMSYHPDDVELWIMDLKGTAQITNIIEHCPPHIKYLLVPKGEKMIFAFLDRIEKEYKRRINFLNNVGRPEKYRHYEKWEKLLDVPKEVYFPAIFVIIDEVSILSQAIEKTQGSRYMKDYKATLQNILVQSRAAGFHFIFANQKFTSGLSGFSSTAMEQIRVRMAMSATPQEIQETVNIPKKYLTERQISWIDNLPQYQVLLGKHPEEENELPTLDKMKTLYIPDEDRALQYKRFDWLKQKMVGDKKYDPDRIEYYVEKHPLLYNGEQYTFDECKQNMVGFYERYSQRIDFDPNDLVLFAGYPLNLLPADPVIVRQGENENLAFFADENNCIENLSNTLFACLRSINPKRTKIEIWALQDDKKMKIFPKYWSGFKCVIGEENICKRVKELKEEMFNNSLSNTYILVFRPYMIEHRINRKIEFMKIKNQNSNTMVQGKAANQLLSDDLANKGTDNELNSELSLDGLSNILNISRPVKKNVSGTQGLYDIEEDLKILCQYGSDSGLHFAMIENSWGGFRETRLKIDWFKHIFSIGFPQGDSMNIPFGSVAGKTESDMIFYTDGTKYKLFLPYIHKKD